MNLAIIYCREIGRTIKKNVDIGVQFCLTKLQGTFRKLRDLTHNFVKQHTGG